MLHYLMIAYAHVHAIGRVHGPPHVLGLPRPLRQAAADGAAAGKWTTLTVRIEVADDVRQTRGWVYTAGIDDAESECALDGREWGVLLRNDVAPVALDKQLGELVVEMRSH